MRRSWRAFAVLAAGFLCFGMMRTVENTAAFSPNLSARPLAGRIIGVDAGHGGYDGGCEGVSGVVEKQLNLDVALRLRAELQSMGATVIMSRESDIALIDPKTTTGYKKRKELDNRLRIFRDGNVEVMVSIHMNQFRDADERGAQVFYCGEAESGRVLSACIQEQLYALDPDHARPASAGDYYILNACDASALVECGFLSNAQEERLLQTEEYQTELAQAVARGVAQYFAALPVQEPKDVL